MRRTKSSNPLSHITACILAGGLGTRLRSVVSDRSKVMACVHGRPFVRPRREEVDDVALDVLQEIPDWSDYLSQQACIDRTTLPAPPESKYADWQRRRLHLAFDRVRHRLDAGCW